jgi:predicted DNA-binding protein (MmcQ/YjbR family)
MELGQFNAYCGGFPHATSVIQWGNSHVWKVAGKVLALARSSDGGHRDGGNSDPAELPATAPAAAVFVTFKCSAIRYEMLKGLVGCRPAPYLASRGLLWIQWTAPGGLDEQGLRDAIDASYWLVASGLPKRRRRELGLAEPARAQNHAQDYIQDYNRAALKGSP